MTNVTVKHLCTLFAVVLSATGASQSAVTIRHFEARNLEETSERTANVSMGDLDGDGDLDLVLAKGRHEPQLDRVLLNDGHGGFVATELGPTPDRSYAAVLADIDGDKDLDVLVSNDALFVSLRVQIVALAKRHSLPATYEFREFPAVGGLMSYGPSLAKNSQKVGTYAALILKGAQPSDLPIQQPTAFELVINLATARSLGIQIPPSLLLRADEVIE